MNPLGVMQSLATARPVWLVMEEPEPAVAAGSGGWVFLLALALLGGAIACAGMWMLVSHRRERRLGPSEAAFRRLARRFDLDSAQRALMHRLSSLHGEATPCGLLISEHAFRRAVIKAERDPAFDRSLLAETQRQVF